MQNMALGNLREFLIPRAWEEMQLRIKPHRCSRHLDDFVYGFSTHFDPWPILGLAKCFFTKEKLPLVYPKATSSMIETVELANILRGGRE